MKPISFVLSEILRPYKKQFVGVLILMLIAIALEALSPWPFKFLIDNIVDAHSMPKLPQNTIISAIEPRIALGFLIVLIFFLTNIMLSFSQYFRSISLKRLVIRIIANFSTRSFENLESIAPDYYNNQEIGDYIYRLGYDVAALGDLISQGALPILASGVYISVITIIMFYIDFRLTLISLIALPFLTIGLYFFNKRIVSESRKSERLNSAFFSFIEDTLTQLKVIQAFSQEKRELSLFKERNTISLKTELKLNKLDYLLSLIVGVIIACSYSLIIADGIRGVFAGELTIGSLVVFIFYLDYLVNPIIDIIYAVSALKEAGIKVERIIEFFDNDLKVNSSGKITKLDDGSIEFIDVTLKGQNDVTILDSINFVAEQGKKTVIVGASGSGKSSIISLIPRLTNDPSNGKILLGRNDITEYDLNTLRRNISLVPQEIVLPNDTIRNIISFGKSDCSLEEIQQASKVACADEFIQKFKGGYDFRVGVSGNYLSGGQRQRIMIARAVIKNAPILIFDEIFSSQDIKTRITLLKNLEEFSRNKTVLLVSNIVEIINKADHIIVVNQGKISAVGKHRDLLSRSKEYKLLLGVQ